MPTPQNVVDESMKLVEADPLLAHLSIDARDRLRQIIVQAIASENEACMVGLWNATEGKEREAMVNRFAEITHLVQSLHPARLETTELDTPYWTRWNPGLETDHLSLAEVLDTLPGLSSEEIPAIVKAFENPTSPLKLPGAVTLEHHDVLHVLLGRGLVDQDEAFVLGFSAVADPEFTAADIDRYKVAFSLYPEPFCIRGCDLIAFDLGVQAAQSMNLRGVMELNLSEVRNCLIGDLRRKLGIDKEVLYATYDEERKRIPFTPWSNRLPSRPNPAAND